MLLLLHGICKTENNDDETRTAQQTTKLHVHATIAQLLGIF